MMNPRPYQAEAMQAVNDHLATKSTNPCVVLPTGSGKSPCMAWLIKDWKAGHPPFRCIVLAHRTELVEQNAAELAGMYGGEIGIYASSANRRDTMTDITYASIDSVYNKFGEFPPFDVIIVDEAHRIPVKGEGKYRTFIAGALRFNPNLRVVGFTATPYRVGSGPICHPQHILNEVCYEAKIAPLIEDGYLCKLRAKASGLTPELSAVKKASTGDYKQRELSAVVDVPELVTDAVQEIVKIINSERRNSVVVFCVDIAHSKHVSDAFNTHGIEAPCVTGKTSDANRKRTVRDFRAGKLRVICNVNCYTEGFNVKQVSCVVLLRPTLSAGMYSQMVGRGLRIHPRKTDCLVLDYGGNIDRHGPIDAIDGGVIRLAKCRECSEMFSRALGACPSCDWVIPKMEMDNLEKQEAERKMHDRKAAEAAILSTDEILLQVDAVSTDMHRSVNANNMSSMQTQILEYCFLSHKRRGGTVDARGVDAYHSELKASVFKLPTTNGGSSNPWEQSFSREEIGEKKYKSVQASLSRSVSKLSDRGLITKIQGQGCERWSGVALTQDAIDIMSSPSGVESFKEGKVSLRVTYRCGLQMIPEWVCLDHEGYAGKCAREWWTDRFGWLEAKEITLDNALTDMFLGDRILNRTYSIVCVRGTGKSLKIIKHNLKGWNE